MNAQTTITAVNSQAATFDRYRHECDHGFCTVCGSVWPCWRAERSSLEAAASVAALPVPRLATIAFAA